MPPDPRELTAGFLTDQGSYSDTWVVACPACGFDYSHIRQAFTRLGSDRAEAITYPGTQPWGTTGERRSALVIVFDGECGHAWEVCIQQHKGTNHIEVHTILAPEPPEKP